MELDGIVEIQNAIAFLRAVFAATDELDQTSVRFAIDRVSKNVRRRIGEYEARADKELRPLAGKVGIPQRIIGPYHTGQTVAVGDANGLDFKLRGLSHQLFRMRSAAQEGKIRRHSEFGVADRGSLFRFLIGWYDSAMTKIRHTIDLDSEADARLKALAAERGQDEEVVIADALELLAFETGGPGIEEALLRLDEFNRTQEAVPLEDVKAWVRSWGTANELPPPKPRKLV